MMGRWGDGVMGGRGDAETRRRGDAEKMKNNLNPQSPIPNLQYPIPHPQNIKQLLWENYYSYH